MTVANGTSVGSDDGVNTIDIRAYDGWLAFPLFQFIGCRGGLIPPVVACGAFHPRWIEQLVLQTVPVSPGGLNTGSGL